MRSCPLDLLTTFLVSKRFTSSFSSHSHHILDADTKELIQEKIMASLLRTLEKTKKADVLRHWVVIVRLLGTHLHSGADLINKIMTVRLAWIVSHLASQSCICLGCSERFQAARD